MSYVKSLFANFLIVFFANHILPGIQVVNTTKLPHLGADIPFALVIGVLNSLIYPVLKMIDHKIDALRIAGIAFLLNFAVYAIVKVLPIGIHILSIAGYLIPALVVAVGAFTTNYLALRSGAHYGGSGTHSHHHFRQTSQQEEDKKDLE